MPDPNKPAPTPSAQPLPQQVLAAKRVAVAVTPNPAVVPDKYALRAYGRGKRLTGIDPKTAEGAKAIEDALDDYVMVEPQPSGSRFNFRATCRECAWQTHCQSREDAIVLVKGHAGRHLYQV